MKMWHTPSWYIAYTRPMQEKKVIARFTKKKIEHYCPMKKVNTYYNGRTKITNVPLFPSCVFVHIAPCDHHRVKKIWEVINIVHWLDQPVAIETAEIEMLKNFLNIHTDVILEKIPVYNSRIVPAQRPAHERPGIMQEVRNGFVKLLWPSLGYELRVNQSQGLQTSLTTIEQEQHQSPSLSTWEYYPKN